MTPQSRLDLLADEVLAHLAPLEFDAARTAAEVDAVLRMRYECVVEMGWARPADFPDGRERDDYDDGATFVVCRDAGTVVGSSRLVPPAAGRAPLLEKEFGITLDDAGQVVEVGRVLVLPGYRPGRSHRVLAGLFARGWLLVRELGFDRVVGQAATPILDLYRGLGLEIAVLGPPRTYFDEERYPIEVVGVTGQPPVLGAGDHPGQPPGTR